MGQEKSGMGMADKTTLCVLLLALALVLVSAVFADKIFPIESFAPDDEPVHPLLASLGYGTSPGAPVTIVEFMDYECPFTQEQRPALKMILEEYGIKVNYVQKHFPSPAHTNARMIAAASWCIALLGQDNLNQFDDKVFSSSMALTPVLISDIAGRIGVDSAYLTKCMEDPATTKLVQQDIDRGVKEGVSGTPTLFINGKPMRGIQPYAKLKLIIDSLIEIENAGKVGDQ